MADLFARFKLIDEMSNKLSQMSSAGTDMLNTWQSAGQRVNDALSTIDRGAEAAAKGVDDYSRSVDALERSSSGAVSATTDLEEMFATCEQAAGALTNALDETAAIQENLEAAIKNTGGASEEATEALNELRAAHQEAGAAMENYDAVLISGTDNLEELEAAAERAMHAAEHLAEANGRAAQSTEDLSHEASKAGGAMDDAGTKGVNSISSIGNTLIGAAIAKKLKEAAEAAYELAEAFSEAESTIVIATGASGAALDSLTASMMKTYAASKTGSLGDIAAAIGEINTRLGYTDKRLEYTTALFLDFTAVTGGSITGNIRNVTQLMRQWNIEDERLEETLDKLTLAGQVSGKSVEALSSELTANKEILDELGFTMDESIAMFSQFELNGTKAASVMTGFRTAINNGTISSLEDLNEIFGQIKAGIISAADAGDIFGARAGTTIVHAVKNGTFALDGLVSSLEDAQGTTVKTAEVAQTLGQRWEQAGNNIQAAFTTAIAPTTDKLSSGMASVTNAFGDFLNQHPIVTKAITATGVGLGVVTVAIAAAGVASLKAIPAVAAFGTAFNAALGPINWVAVALGAVTAAGVALIAMTREAEDETLAMTAVTRQQYNELQDLQTEYERACDAYGETSEEASRLKYQLDDLSKSFNSNRQTVDEFVAEMDDYVDRHNRLIESYDNSTQAVKGEETANLALIAKLADMAASTDQTAASQEAMNAIIQELNGSLNGVSISYEQLMRDQEGSIRTLREYAKAQAEQEMRQAKVEQYVKLLKDQAEGEEKLAKATDEAAAAQERLERAQDAYNASEVWHGNSAYHDSGATKELNAAKTAAAKTEQVLLDVQNALDDTNHQLTELEDEWNSMSKTIERSADVPVLFHDAVSTALESVKDDLDELCTAYADAYDSAYSAIDGMYGLFEKADTRQMENNVRGTFGLFEQVSLKADATARQMVRNLESQTAAYTNYATNLAKASDLGIDSRLLESLSDGSESSMANLQTIISYVNYLGADSDRAKAYIDQLNEAYSNNQAAQAYFDKASESVDTYVENLRSQSEAISQYLDNIRKAQELDLDEGLIASLSDGSKESAAQLQAIIDKVNELGESSDEAQAFVADMNSAFAGVQEAKDEFAETVAKMETGFDEKMSEIEARLADAIEEMNQEEDAAAAAKATIDAYTKAILDGADDAAAAARGVAAGVSASLYWMHDPGMSLPGHAGGTDYAENAFVAGEEGPELIRRAAESPAGEPQYYIAGQHGPEIIVGEQGAKVYTNEETERILQGNESIPSMDYAYDMSRRLETEPVLGILPEFMDWMIRQALPSDEAEHTFGVAEELPLETEAEPDSTGNDGGGVGGRSIGGREDSKHIYLDINGAGSIEISPHMDREEVLEILQENIKPVLVGLIQEEIFEEGDGSYEF